MVLQARFAGPLGHRRLQQQSCESSCLLHLKQAPQCFGGNPHTGRTTIGSKSWFTAVASASYSYEVDSAGNPKADFAWNGPSLGNTCDYSLTGAADQYHPHFGDLRHLRQLAAADGQPTGSSRISPHPPAKTRSSI